MVEVIGVRFRTAGKIYFFDPKEFQVRSGDHVIVETARGIEFGSVVSERRQVKEKCIGDELKPVLRIATKEDEERAAKNREKKLLVEEYIGSADGTLPEDYKFYCFHGRADCVMLCVGRDEGWPKFYFFDRDFRLLRINRDSQAAPEDFTLPKPAGLDEALAIADRLSKPFDFVRVDLYLTPRGVRFGELTFTPAAALDNKRLPETDLRFGRRMEETL